MKRHSMSNSWSCYVGIKLLSILFPLGVGMDIGRRQIAHPFKVQVGGLFYWGSFNNRASGQR